MYVEHPEELKMRGLHRTGVAMCNMLCGGGIFKFSLAQNLAWNM